MNPTPTPTPFDPAATAANVALSDYYLAIILIVAAILVIVLALGFALLYHLRAFDVIRAGVRKGLVKPEVSNDDAFVQSDTPTIKGPDTGAVAAELVYVLDNIPADAVVSWEAVDGAPSASGGRHFITTFAKEGTFSVTATYGTPAADVTKKVTIGEPSAPAAAPSPVMIPFVVKNWGRLVIVLFGVGVISALMATRVVSAEAGIGILGALLGVGAVTANTGGTSSGAPQSDGDGAPAKPPAGGSTTK